MNDEHGQPMQILYVDPHKLRSGQCWPNDYVSDHARSGYTKYYPEFYVQELLKTIKELKGDMPDN
jgi:hypothetical protein